MKADLHVHTEFSCDSQAGMEQYVKQAEKIGITVVCFTDHVDFNPEDYGYRFYNPSKFFEKYNNAKTACNSRTKLCAGMEFSEPHLYAEELNRLAGNYPYDYVIGSIHWIGNLFPCKKTREQYPAKDFFTLYWDEVLNTVKQGGFDALGHMDFPKRYYGEVYYSEAKINEIFKYLLDKDIVIEVNTSSLRKGYGEAMPGKELLELYKANGGRYVTIGSDAHAAEDLGADISEAKEQIKALALQEVIYENRKRMIVSEG